MAGGSCIMGGGGKLGVIVVGAGTAAAVARGSLAARGSAGRARGSEGCGITAGMDEGGWAPASGC